MVGIRAVGTYIPLWRLGTETKDWRSRNERSVAGIDEDSITMAVAAVIDCLGDIDRSSIDAIYFATTTPPYLEKNMAVVIAAAANLRPELSAVDFTGSLRAGTTALRAAMDAVKAGSAKHVVVVAADQRKAPARTEMEAAFGDAAVALLISDSDAFVNIEDSSTVTHEIHDVWRSNEDKTLVSWEDRFVFDQGYLRAFPKAVLSILEKNDLTIFDLNKVAYYAPDSRRQGEMARKLGLKPEQIIGANLFNTVGNCGAAFSLMLLAAALDGAKTGEKILLAGYGNGVDAFILKVTAEAGENSLKQQIDSKRFIEDYMKYAQWRGFIEFVPAQRRPVAFAPAASSLFREQNEILRFQGSKCHNCGYEQYPPQRVCTRCQTKDDFELVNFAHRKAILITYSIDYMSQTLNPPSLTCMINFVGGGRTLIDMTDFEEDKLKVDMPVEMTFRKLHTNGSIHNYYWRCMPTRKESK